MEKPLDFFFTNNTKMEKQVPKMYFREARGFYPRIDVDNIEWLMKFKQKAYLPSRANFCPIEIMSLVECTLSTTTDGLRNFGWRLVSKAIVFLKSHFIYRFIQK